MMNKYLYILFISLVAAAEADAQNAPVLGSNVDAPSKLVVNIVVDQLRSDYLHHNMPRYGSGGFRKLMTQGMVFDNAVVPFLPVDIASATAAVSTATTPRYNGIPSEEWISRKTARKTSCTADQTSLLTPRAGGPTPVNLVVSTLGDEIKIASLRAAKVFSVALTADAAVMLAGHCADGAFWIDPQSAQWTTSDFYQKRMAEWAAEFNRQQTAQRRKLLSAQPAKTTSRKTTGQRNDGRKDVPSYGKQPVYAKSPSVNRYITDFALRCVEAENLGGDNVPDLLNVMYFAGDTRTSTYDGDTQIAETYKEIDNAIAALVLGIEQRVGKKNVLFAVTSTGYYDQPVVDYPQYNVPSGTVYINRTANLLNMYLSAIYGQAHYVEAFKDNHIYLDHKLIERKRLHLNEVLERSREMIVMSDGVSDAYTSFGLQSTPDAELLKLKNGFNIDVCGDLVIGVSPGWNIYNEETHEQQKAKLYGFRFPIILYGADVKPSVVTSPVTIEQIAPTVSRHLRIRAPNAARKQPLY